eukprot:g35112.t1
MTSINNETGRDHLQVLVTVENLLLSWFKYNSSLEVVFIKTVTRGRLLREIIVEKSTGASLQPCNPTAATAWYMRICTHGGAPLLLLVFSSFLSKDPPARFVSEEM